MKWHNSFLNLYTELMSEADQQMKDILLTLSYVSEEDMKKGEEYANLRHVSLVDALVALEIINREILGKAVAEHYEVPYIDLQAKPPTGDQILKLPEDIAKKYIAVIAAETDKVITIATTKPHNEELIAAVQQTFPDKEVKVGYSPRKEISALWISYLKPLTERYQAIIDQGERVAPQLLEALVEDAVAKHASDIHFEPQEKEVIFRFRIDGVLQEAVRLSKDLYENVLNRIKVESKLRIDEHFSSQDGAMRYRTETTSVDMRVSIIPTLDGEKVVIRLLSAYVRDFTFQDLGLTEKNESIIMEAAKKPFGMLLVTGPTGSGKSSTLYGLLKLLNHPDVNITTIEDPVEYKIAGVNQIQVNNATNLTFAKGLRSIVRQDPNIILVGEIRDLETAEIAVNAALTGHLLFSTFHANDAPTAIPRLMDMGIEPFLLASTLELVISQRLVRKICESCRYSSTVKLTEIEKQFSQAKHYFKKEETLYKGKGCSVCNSTGYKGRTAIFEYIQITREMEDLMLTNPSSKQIWELARKQGSRSLFEDGIEKVKQGVTTIEELLRVAAPPELQQANERKGKSKKN